MSSSEVPSAGTNVMAGKEVEVIGIDPVAAGMAEWRKVQVRTAMAEERAAKAEAEASYLRGQNDLLTKQNVALDERLHDLQQKYDELHIVLEALASAMITAIEKQRDGGYRPVATHNGQRRGIDAEAVRAAVIADLERKIATSR